jgi:hypothetical protein
MSCQVPGLGHDLAIAHPSQYTDRQEPGLSATTVGHT